MKVDETKSSAVKSAVTTKRQISKSSSAVQPATISKDTSVKHEIASKVEERTLATVGAKSPSPDKAEGNALIKNYQPNCGETFRDRGHEG